MSRDHARSYTTRIFVYREKEGLSKVTPERRDKHRKAVAAFRAGSSDASRRGERALRAAERSGSRCRGRAVMASAHEPSCLHQIRSRARGDCPARACSRAVVLERRLEPVVDRLEGETLRRRIVVRAGAQALADCAPPPTILLFQMLVQLRQQLLQ